MECLKYLSPVSIYGLFVVPNAQEAVRELAAAFQETWGNDIKPIEFDDDGFLTLEHRVDEGRKFKSETDDTIRLAPFSKEALLQVQLFYEDTLEPMHGNIMLHRYMVRHSEIVGL